MLSHSVLRLALLAFCLTRTVYAMSWTDRVGILLSKRAAPADCQAGIESSCDTDPADCVAAMCEACSSWQQIAECCALTETYMRLQCAIDALQNLSGETATSSGATTEAVSPTATGLSITTGPSMASTSAATGLSACQAFESIVASCESQSPGFSAEPSTQRASCLCYASGTYDADRYNGASSSCIAYLSTAAPPLYASFTAQHTGGVDVPMCSHLVNGSASTTSDQITATWTSTSLSLVYNSWFIGYTTISGSSPTPTV